MTYKQLMKSFTFLFILIFFITGFFPSIARANPADPLNISAEAAILVDGESGRILYEKNPDESLHPASMAKMMTEYILLESIKEGKITWDQETSISDYVYKISQDTDLSNVPLRRDYKYTVKELYESVAIYSANGSAIALAELIAGSETNFIKTMNDKAKELGLKDYKFVNCTGLNNIDLKGMHPQGTANNEENVMSARAVATLAFRLLHDYPEVLQTTSIPVKNFRENTSDVIRMDNWNWMLPGSMYPALDYPGVDGLKTGTTDLGGYSFTATAKKGDMRIISVVMKTGSYDERFGETKKLLDYGFSNYSMKQIFPAGYKIPSQPTVPVVKGKEKTVDVETEKPLMIAIKSGEESLFDPVYMLDSKLAAKDGSITAPLEKGQAIGYMTVNYKGTESLGYLTDDSKEKVSLITSKAANKAGWVTLLFRSIIEFFASFFKG